MIDYIRKGVELADGWRAYDTYSAHNGFTGSYELLAETQYALDALAAQLVRQVDFHGYYVTQYVARTDVIRIMGQEVVASSKTDDLCDDNARTMNTIKAIVDSKVLEND